MSSIYELYTENDSDNRSISTSDLENIRDDSQIYPDINAIDARFKIHDPIKKTQSE